MYTELVQLAKAAQLHQSVANDTIDNGMHVFIYPTSEGNLICVGYPAHSGRSVRLVDVMRRRDQNLQRFGCWLPTLHNDGTLYLAKRFGVFSEDRPPMTEEELYGAEELLQ